MSISTHRRGWSVIESLEPRLLLAGDLFMTHDSYALAGSSRMLAVGDVSGDGNADIVAAVIGATTVQMLINRGDGSFVIDGNVETGVHPWGVALGDMNNDGRLDIIVSSYDDNKVAVVLNQGGGTFASPLVFDAGSKPMHIAIGDLDRSGTQDVFVLDYDGTIAALRGNGDGTLQTAVTSKTGPTPWGVALGDYNDDGTLDAITGSRWGNALSIEIGNGDGTFTHYTAAMGAPYISLAASDFNGDGREDVAIGLFNGITPYVASLTNINQHGYDAAAAWRVNAVALSLTVADFDDDGRSDIATGGDYGGSILLGNGDGNFRDAGVWGTSVEADFIASGDFNNDGYTDLVATGGGSSLTVMLNGEPYRQIQSLSVNPTTITRGSPVTLTAVPVAGPGGSVPSVVKVNFYRDANGNGIAEDSELVGSDADGLDGFSFTVTDTASLPLGANVFLARGFDRSDVGGKALAVNVHVVHVVGTWTSGGTIVTAYDLAGEPDIGQGNVQVTFSGNGIKSIKLVGGGSGLALGIAGAGWVGSITDSRKGGGDVVFVASTAPIGSMSIKTSMAGYCLNGLQMTGFDFPSDADGDGDVMDRTAVFVNAGQPAAATKALNKSITVGGNLTGSVVLTGGLGKLTVKGTTAWSTMKINWGPIIGDMSMSFAQVWDTSIDTWGPIKSLSAMNWLDRDARTDTITAGYIGTLSIKGARGISGDMSADVNVVSGAYRGGIGKMTVAGHLRDAMVNSASGSIGAFTVNGWTTGSQVRTAGSIGTISLGAADRSDFLAGMTNDTARHATAYTSFAGFSSIKSITVKANTWDTSFSAGRITKASLKNVRYTNNGNQFGVFARGDLGGAGQVSVSNSSPRDGWTWKSGQPAPVRQDFMVRIF
jgi:hypothetical protein